MEKIITVGAAFLGLAFTIINSFVIWDSVGLKLKGFVSVKSKSNLYMNNLIMYLILILMIVYFAIEYHETSERWEQYILFGLLVIWGLLLVISLFLLIYISVNRVSEVYYIISNKMYRLKHIENDIVFLVSMTPDEDVLLKDKTFLLKNEHEILNNAEYKKKKKEMPYLFKDI
ncbi:hypothetical protein ACRW9N_02375 [Listeria aquatica]|uniref:hypothetical protein n=1 Tax=Listeria aquatica TaxID=1494960 RepID=UPI003EF5BBC9